VLFTLGHGEELPRELFDVFVNNGFLVETIDLSKDDLPEDARILVICNPKKDFLGADPENPMLRSEIDKVASFLNNFGSVMYFSEPNQGPFPELDDLMREHGMMFGHEFILIDERNSIGHQNFLDTQYFVAENVGDELHASIRRQATPPRTVMPRTKPIFITPRAGERTVSPVLTSFPTSYMVHISENIQSAQGESILLAVSQRTRYIDNNPQTSLFLVSGSYEFLGYLPSNAYSNSDIILNAMRIMTNKRIAVTIGWKEFDRQGLDMSLEAQNRWMLICIFLLPAVVSTIGIIVWLRRRYS